MKTKKKFYFGNNPNSPDYNDNIPIGQNKWDYQETLSDNEENDLEDIRDEELIEENENNENESANSL